ncbi:MAG: adenylosuccinate synthase [Bacteroidota bacterium]
MPVTIIVGAQWGDEGKGKVIDLLSEDTDIVARYQGGANAGHTVCIDDRNYVLHLIPSGIFHDHVSCVIGNGVVIDPVALMDEIKMIESFGISIKGRLFISHNAHLIMPYHKMIDKMREEGQGTAKIGTTGRGIGPAYIDKASRVGIKIVDLLNRKTLADKLKKNIEEKNQLLRKIYDSEELDVEKIILEYQEFDEKIDEYITDTAFMLNNAIAQGKRILAEGAQGALLDMDHGTYPYVTSSNPTSGGACTGLGIPPTSITSIIGVTKAYTTRVGNGPFPTELDNSIGQQLRDIGHEYGATTGRPRRCGWFDAVSLRYSIMINGISDIAITKLDVLDEFEEINICVGYEYQGRRIKTFPTDCESLSQITPIYETFQGWKQSLSGVRDFVELPHRAQEYIAALGRSINTRVSIVSVGARRDQTIILNPPST